MWGLTDRKQHSLYSLLQNTYCIGLFCWIFLSIRRFFSSIKWFRDDSHPLHPLTAHKHTFTLFHRREESPRAKPHTHTSAPRSCSPGRSATALRVCVYYYSKVFNLTFFLSLSTISVFLSHTHAVNPPQLCHMSYKIQYSCVPLRHTPKTGLEWPKCLHMCVCVNTYALMTSISACYTFSTQF